MKKLLATVRAVAITLTMAIMLGLYYLTRLVWEHNDVSSFSLRRRWINWWGLPLLGIKVEVQGQQADVSAIYVCNHRSFSDPLINSKYIDAFIIAKAEIAQYPLINKGAETTGIIWVDRLSTDSRLATREAMVHAVQTGRNILVYPEGTVSNLAGTLPYKRGPFKSAAQHNLPIVPIAIDYRDSKDLWVEGSLLSQYFRQFGAWRTQVRMHIGPVMQSEDADRLYRDVEIWTQEHLRAIQAGWSRAQYGHAEA